MTALALVAAVIAGAGAMFLAFVLIRACEIAVTHHRHVRRQQRRGGAR